MLYLTCFFLRVPDDSKVVKSLGGSKLPSNLRLEEKIEFLQRAEERYYQNEVSDRQVDAEMLCALAFAVSFEG